MTPFQSSGFIRNMAREAGVVKCLTAIGKNDLWKFQAKRSLGIDRGGGLILRLFVFATQLKMRKDKFQLTCRLEFAKIHFRMRLSLQH